MAVSTLRSPSISETALTSDLAIWLDPSDSSRSLVIGALGNGGISTFNLDGTQSQLLSNQSFFGVDVAYSFFFNGVSTDILVASDPIRNTIQIFRIDPISRQLIDVTDPSVNSIFNSSGNAGENVLAVDLFQNSRHYAFISRSNSSVVGQWELVDRGNGSIGIDLVRSLSLPAVPTLGVNGEVLNPQVKGIVSDRDAGFVYFAQENVGIWKFEAAANGAQAGLLIDRVQREGGQNLANSIDGLALYTATNGTGYLLVSSQISNNFATYDRIGNNNNTFLGNLNIAEVERSKGIEVLNVSLGQSFAQGLLVVQNSKSNDFHFVPWQNVAADFAPTLAIDPTGSNPRTEQPLPPVSLTGNPNNISNDLLVGGNEPEILDGRYGDDTIDGRGGDDRIYGNIRRDSLIGGAGNDSLFGGIDNDILNGGADNDYLAGELGNDSLFGGEGNDTLIGITVFRPTFNFGALEIDTLTGGSGSDLFILGDSDRPYYNDLNGITTGSTDYALITDFELNQDFIQLNRGSSYVLGNLPVGLPPGTGLYLDSDGTAGFSRQDELVAAFLLYNQADLANLNSRFILV